MQVSNIKTFFFLDQKHYIAIGQMGNYQEYLKMVAPLREVDPGQTRLHAFGNPFKLKQDHQVVFLAKPSSWRCRGIDLKTYSLSAKYHVFLIFKATYTLLSHVNGKPSPSECLILARNGSFCVYIYINVILFKTN